ncbi:MAG: TOMM precursor leader peptide-binding protein [Okeania sp. SIO2G4]|uniref:TOMM precursor leader peptide-binding protein n=1 Tax=unclassified Okeania TaxID=2634635 RepID=UPI0013B7D487|nr:MULTISPECIES: TOMM precursor leader peptide-binding protein [unclassified Okeania]NEP72425.1 TOMM precursor leader peptide-binding protein [Okeania sp. SIO2G5]NEP93085.1 TOMM precursor leader peptide-binding protein [Okeania sp. SIO2F5]NEQ91771.1 TOMM precursor leader peptide-binding protein [Okeania sp. SIO2G4]
MLNQPSFNPAYLIETLEPDTVFFISERESVCLQDPLYYRLVQLIDGKRNVDEIIDILQLEILQYQELTPENPNFFQDILNLSIKIQQALFQLNKQGYLLENHELLPSNLAIFCHHLQISQSQAYNQLQSTKVTVKTLGSVTDKDFISLLKSFQIQVADSGDLTIILTDDYLHPNLDEFNKQTLASQTPWMLIKPLGTIAWIGPLFQPYQTGCWDCFAQRWRDNRPIEDFINRKKEGAKLLTSPLGFSQATIQTTLTIAATEIFKWIIQKGNPRLAGNLITYDHLTLQTQNHILVKRPQCFSCGKVFNKQPLPVVLGHRKKSFTADGGHRFCSPEETLRKYQYHISPITGVVRELAKIPTQGLLHTYVARHHFRNVFDDLDGLRKNMGGKSSGKGRTDIQARASGFCEAIERYSGVFQGDEIREQGSYEKLVEKAIHPNQCMIFSEEQYQNRKEWNFECKGWFQKVPEPFDETRVIDWTPVWSLTAQEFKYLPTSYCYYGYPESDSSDFLDCWADSNGCAAGNTIEEAILQGFMELVERDCVALWWYNRLSKPQVDLDSFKQPYFQQLKQYYQSLNRDLWVLDITSDLNIPCFAAISSRNDREVEDIVLGYGAHFDPEIAISRALTEANQILPNVLSFRDDGTTNYPPSADILALKWWQTATLINQPYLVPNNQIISKKSNDYFQLASDDLLEDVKLCQQIVEKNDMELLVLDQTRSDIGLRVAKVIVPGMRHMWKRLGLGRLYDVPVKMGCLKESLTEEQLNPFPMWM